MGETGVSRAAEVRAKLDHPMIDGDSHIATPPCTLGLLALGRVGPGRNRTRQAPARKRRAEPESRGTR